MAECFVAVILKNLNTPAADAGLEPKTVTMDVWNGKKKSHWALGSFLFRIILNTPMDHLAISVRPQHF